MKELAYPPDFPEHQKFWPYQRLWGTPQKLPEVGTPEFEALICFEARELASSSVDYLSGVYGFQFNACEISDVMHVRHFAESVIRKFFTAWAPGVIPNRNSDMKSGEVEVIWRFFQNVYGLDLPKVNRLLTYEVISDASGTEYHISQNQIRSKYYNYIWLFGKISAYAARQIRQGNLLPIQSMIRILQRRRIDGDEEEVMI